MEPKKKSLEYILVCLLSKEVVRVKKTKRKSSSIVVCHAESMNNGLYSEAGRDKNKGTLFPFYKGMYCIN